MTVLEAITSATEKLAAAGIPTARLDAEVLLRFVLNKDRAWFLAHIQDRLPEEAAASLQTLTARRAKREPLQYITGHQEFWGIDFLVSPAVLIPRPETELIIETSLGALGDRKALYRIVDLCTGSGCISVSLAREFPQARLFATDLSPAALAVARENCIRNAVAERVELLEGDLFAPLEDSGLRGSIDLVVANPPYVPDSDRPTLQPEVRDHEPELALFGGLVGTEVHQRIITDAAAFLKSGGMLLMEMGIGQAEALRTLAERSGAYGDIDILKDLAGIDRVIAARKK